MKAYVLVGAPGSGKSTLAAELSKSENAVVISGDDVREELYGDASIQGQSSEISDRIDALVSESCGLPVILDGTHYLASYRREALALLRSYGYTEITAVVLNPSLATCLARNFKRKRNVPDYIVKGIHERLQSSLLTLDTEGFTSVEYVPVGEVAQSMV
jgi:predicted kinase